MKWEGLRNEAICRKRVKKMTNQNSTNQLTQDMTEFSKEHSDTMQSGLGLGNNAPLQEVENILEQPKEQKEYEEKATTQGEYEQELYNYQKELDRLQNNVEQLENILNGKNIVSNYEKYVGHYEAYKKYYNDYLESDYYAPYANGWEKYIKNEIQQKIEAINNEMPTIRNNINNIKNNENYDNRTDPEKRQDDKDKETYDRADTSWERVVKDMRTAGLNPALATAGANIGGGAGQQGSGKAEEENKKRKKRKLEEEARARAIAQEKQRILSSIIMALGIGAPRMLNALPTTTTSDTVQLMPDITNTITKTKKGFR